MPDDQTPVPNRVIPYQDDQELFGTLDRLFLSDLVMIDGGARNGTWELPRLAKYIVSYGFEPNPQAYAYILRQQATFNDSQYKKVTYLPLALLEKSGEATLYVTKRPGATSTLRPNAELLAHFDRDNWSQMREVVSEEAVRGISLQDFVASEGMTYADYIKLDTQGNELNILKSGGEFLRHVSVIRTEVEMISIYENQSLLGDVCSFLAGRGFQLVDIQWTHPCRRYHFSPYLSLDSYRLVWGDAIFAYDPFNFVGERKLEQGVILAELGYLDLGLYIIENVPSITSEHRKVLIDFYQKPKQSPSRSAIKRLLKRYIPASWIEAYRVLKQSRVSKEVARVP